MSVYSLYFSPTGGTKKVMDILAGEWMNVQEIDLTQAKMDYSQYQFRQGDICLIGMPAYGGRVPGAVIERINTMEGNGAGAIIVVVYGNRAYDDTFLELKNELEASHFLVKAGIAAVAEHSIMRQFGAGRPDARDEEELKQFAGKIQAAWESAEKAEVPGNYPYREYHGVPFKPRAGKKCNGCGRCAQLCPVQAISPENLTDVNEETCISCMRCITICPQHARKLNSVVLFIAAQGMKKKCSGRKKNELFL